jgi:cytochrome c
VIRYAFLGLLLAAAAAAPALADDAAAGEKAFGVCRACHQVGPSAKNAVGPVLNGVVGRKAGTAPGFSYSPAMKDFGKTWDQAELATYLDNPQQVVKGTKMAFPGVKDPQKVNDIIAFLSQYDESGQKKQ